MGSGRSGGGRSSNRGDVGPRPAPAETRHRCRPGGAIRWRAHRSRGGKITADVRDPTGHWGMRARGRSVAMAAEISSRRAGKMIDSQHAGQLSRLLKHPFARVGTSCHRRRFAMPEELEIGNGPPSATSRVMLRSPARGSCRSAPVTREPSPSPPPRQSRNRHQSIRGSTGHASQPSLASGPRGSDLECPLRGSLWPPRSPQYSGRTLASGSRRRRTSPNYPPDWPPLNGVLRLRCDEDTQSPTSTYSMF
ncbi:hypothetical protein GGP96_001012 [Salinibacter ruber]|nr:hypothetical protein [Salinibacter ruber]MCS4152340.1 hypothetical protein [Salinibacter ruber]MCS4176299.1 hypothetical protein [Salinibacter ruber]